MYLPPVGGNFQQVALPTTHYEVRRWDAAIRQQGHEQRQLAPMGQPQALGDGVPVEVHRRHVLVQVRNGQVVVGRLHGEKVRVAGQQSEAIVELAIAPHLHVLLAEGYQHLQRTNYTGRRSTKTHAVQHKLRSIRNKKGFGFRK